MQPVRLSTVRLLIVMLPQGRQRYIMSENNQPEDDSRRTFLKGAAATGVAATGLTALTGNAAAQRQRVRNLNLGNLTVTQQNGLVNVSIPIRNNNVLNNINIEDIFVTIIGGGISILENVNIEDSLNDVIDVTLNDIDIDVLNNALNQNDVQVSVVVLGSGGNVLAAGDTIA